MQYDVVYKNKELATFLNGLEYTYKITDECNFFAELVNFSKNKDIPYHKWFKYREGYSHTLIQELIKRSKISKDEYVIDPFCGSGTTVIEANLDGFSGIGIDINPMSSFISKIKCCSYTHQEVQELEARIDDIKKQSFDGPCDTTPYAAVEKFFPKENFVGLLNVKAYIERFKSNTKIYNFLRCAYICIVEPSSNRKRDGNGLKTIQSKVKSVKDFYLTQCNNMLSDIKAHPIPSDVKSCIEFGNALDLYDIAVSAKELKGLTPGAIMYSPPYPNSFDYFESYKLEIIMADYAVDLKDINKYRTSAVESFIGQQSEIKKTEDFIKWISEEIKQEIPVKEARTGKKDGRTRRVPKMLIGYFSDMEKVIEQSSKLLPSGKYCYIVVDQSSYLGKVVPTDLLLAKLSEIHGFSVEDIIVCRKAKTSGQQVFLYPYLKDGLRESIVVLKKI